MVSLIVPDSSDSSGYGDIPDADLKQAEDAGYGKKFFMKSLWHQSAKGELCVKSYWFDDFTLDWGNPAGGGSGTMEKVLAEKPDSTVPRR